MTTINWFAMRSKPNKEEFLAGQLRASGLDVFLPVLRVKPVNPRSKKLRPYFPSYLFVQVDFDKINISDLKWMPGASDLVSFDGEPASVPDLLIEALRKQVDRENETLRNETKNFQAGDTVRIQNGPFTGYEAVFDMSISGEDRVRVLLNLLQDRQIPVEIDGEQIKSIKRR